MSKTQIIQAVSIEIRHAHSSSPIPSCVVREKIHLIADIVELTPT